MIRMRARPANRFLSGESSALVSSERQRILAIDYGRKRLGLAISDELQATARPLLILERANRRDLIKRLRNICRDYGVARILVGHPLRLRGGAGPMAEEASRFAARLARELGLEVELCDERLTSWEARQVVRESGSTFGRKNSHMDDVAAAILLREYLDRERGPAARSASEGA
jgi:putative holliday junction resolvase